MLYSFRKVGMSSIPCTDTIASSPKTGEVDLHMTLAVMSDTENTFISGIKAEKDEEVSQVAP